MLINIEISEICKVFRIVGLYFDRHTFCLTLLWYYKARYDTGKGLFRLHVGKFVEYNDKVGIKLDIARFSWAWFKKDVVGA